MEHTKVLYLKLNVRPFTAFVETICTWAECGTEQAGATEQSPKGNKLAGRYVCVASTAACMQSFEDEAFRRICGEADLVTPDGMPIVWALRRLGYGQQQRVCGPDLMKALCGAASRRGIPIGLYGGTTELELERLCQSLQRDFPTLHIAYAYAPPFRPVGAAAPTRELEAIRHSGARLLFVGIGCPKQEFFMAQHKAELPLVMLGVGAAFLFHSGQVRRAPKLMQRIGLEWLFRLVQEPKRLFRRYLKTNLAFLWHSRLLSARQLRKYL